MNLTEERSVEDWCTDCAETSQTDFDRVRVFCCETERSTELVMLLVDALVEWTPVQRPMEHKVPSVFEHKKDCNLFGH